MSRFSVSIFLSDIIEIFSTGTILCFKISPVSKNFRNKRGGGFHDFPSKMLHLTATTSLAEEPFCASESSGYQNFLRLRGEKHEFL